MRKRLRKKLGKGEYDPRNWSPVFKELSDIALRTQRAFRQFGKSLVPVAERMGREIKKATKGLTHA